MDNEVKKMIYEMLDNEVETFVKLTKSSMRNLDGTFTKEEIDKFTSYLDVCLNAYTFSSIMTRHLSTSALQSLLKDLEEKVKSYKQD